MSILKVYLSKYTNTTEIIDEYRTYEKGYDTLLLADYLYYRNKNGKLFDIDLIIDGNPPQLEQRGILNPFSVSFTELKQKNRDVNYEISFYERYPEYKRKDSPWLDICNYVLTNELQGEVSTDIIYFTNPYYLKAQSSNIHLNTGYGDYNMYRISGYRIHSR